MSTAPVMAEQRRSMSDPASEAQHAVGNPLNSSLGSQSYG